MLQAMIQPFGGYVWISPTRPNATFEEKTKGSIEPGKFADLVVLEQDIMTAPEKSIESMKVLMTMVGGKIVYQRQGFSLVSAAR